jgi:hypothetical protein
MRLSSLMLALLLLAPSQSRQADRVSFPGNESLQYTIEWRLVHAGNATLGWKETGGGVQARLQIQSVGLVSMLYRVDDLYTADLNANLCAVAAQLNAFEGLRQRETKVAYDAGQRKAHYVERDVRRNVNLRTSQIDIPPCTHEIVGALYALRGMRLPAGKSVDIPISDGKKSAMARVEAQGQETVETPAGKFKTIRYEAFLFNDVLYHRNGRLHIWLTDDDRRLPVQIRVRLEFHVGTITLQLEKVGGA